MVTREIMARIVAAFDRANLLIIGAGTVDVWLKALDDLEVEELVDAAEQIVRTRRSDQRYVTPGDVRAVARPRQSSWDRAKNVTRNRAEIEGGERKC